MTLKIFIDFMKTSNIGMLIRLICRDEKTGLNFEWIDETLLNAISVSTQADHENLCQIFELAYLKKVLN